MKVFGNWLYKVTSEDGKEEFKKYYNIDPFEYMIRNRITFSTTINSKDKSALVILDCNNKVLQILFLEENEYVNICTKNASANNRLLESHGMAFIWCETKMDNQVVYALEGKCYDMKISDWIEVESMQQAINTVQTVLKKYNIELSDLENKILFIKQV